MINNEIKVHEKYAAIIFENVTTIIIPKSAIESNIVDFLKHLKLETMNIAKKHNLIHSNIYNNELINKATMMWVFIKIEKDANNE